MVERLGPEVESTDPLEVASLFEANFSRPSLVEFLRDNLQVSDLRSNALHECLLDLNPSKIVTTNFDDLFERVLEQRKIPYASAATNEELSLTGDGLLVLKPHGDFKHPDSLVFSRRDYARYPQHRAINATLCSWVARYSFLFVGYSLSDPDLEHQLQGILDAQGDLARTHYILIDSTAHQRRNALLRLRNIHVIELGSYDNLEIFLTDLSNEAETIRSREIKSQPLYAARSLESSELSVAEQQLLEVLSEDYTPVVQALEQSHFVDAEDHLQRVLKKIDNFGANPGLGQKIEFKSFHQRVLLASAAVAARRQKSEEARELFLKAEALQPFAEKRRLQAAEVLLHLGDFQKVEPLLSGSAEAQETRGKEILGLVALLRNDEGRFHELYPNGDENNLEFVIQQARLAMESSQDDTAEPTLDLLDRAWTLSRDFPQGLFIVAGMTDNMLRRIVTEEWEAPGVNREELLKTIRERYQEVLSAFEGFADQYPEGLVLVLSSLLSFHRILHEDEAQQSILRRLQSLSPMPRERVLAEHLAGTSSPPLEFIESLFQNNLTSDEKLLLKGDALKRDGKKSEAEQTYRQALLQGEKSEVQQALILALLELLLEQERHAEALALLDESLEDGPFRALMGGMVLSHRNDQEGALATIQLALTEHPRNMLLRKNCVHLLRQKGTLTEALEQAECLEELLPSFEHKLLRANLLEQLGQNEETLQIVREIEGEGYITLPLVELKCNLFQKLGQHRESAEFLESHQDRYSDNSTLYYSFRFNEATAWASTGEIDKAVAIWEDLREHSESGSDLYRNLYIAYVQREAYDPGAFSKAFNVAKEALEKFPDCHEFAPYLIEAGLGSGRSEEAWEIIGRRPELKQNAYLRAIPSEEAIEALSQQTQVLRATEDFYRAGGIPFFAYADRSPRTPLFLWVARTVLWRKGSRETPLLCGFSRLAFGTKRLQIPSGGIILDQTALLTLGVLGVTGEVLEAIGRAGKSALFFPGARVWIEQEIAQLSVNQFPAYREQYKYLQSRLLAERGRVEIVEEVNNQKNPLDEITCRKLGLSAWDVGLAVTSGAYYVDDYLSPEGRESISPECAISSSDLFGALVNAGVLFPEEEAQIRKTHPDPFAEADIRSPVSLDKPFVFSLSTLLSWLEAGLLERWLTDGSGWPTRIIVGPIAWLQLGKEIAEENIYREALQIATNLKAAITEAFRSDVAEELPSTDPPDIGIHASLRDFFQQPLILLSYARDRQAALWTDDLCSRLLTDSRGPLLQDQQIIDIAGRARNAFSEVSVIGTEDVLSWLEDSSQLSEDRQLTLVWQLHQDGYRFLDVGDVLLWLLKRFNYNLDAVHIDELLRDLKRAPGFTLPEANSERLSLLISHTLSQVLSKTIWNLWTLESPQLSQNRKREISNELVEVFENAAGNSQLEQLFWKGLISRAWGDGRDKYLKEFLEWIEGFISTNIDSHRPILRYIEELTLDVLQIVNSDDEKAKVSVQHLLLKLLAPFFSQKLLKEFHPVFRRLIGVALGLSFEFTRTFQGTGPQEEYFEITLNQEEIEKQACRILTQFLSGERPTELSFLHPFYIGIQLERTIDGSIVETPDGQPFRVGGQEEVSLLFLPLVANSFTRRKLFDHFFALLEEVDPPLASTIRELEDALASDDPAISTQALRNFYCSYLLSTHFQLMRDLVRGFEHLSTLPLEKFDALIGPLPLWPEEERFQEVIEKFASEKQKSHENSSLQKVSQQLLFLCAPSELIFPFIRLGKSLSDLPSNGHQFDELSRVTQAIETGPDMFHSLVELGTLLFEACRSVELKVSVRGKEKLLREWLTEHLIGVLRHQLREPSLSASADERFFPDRQTIHARSLRYAFRAAASPTHGEALIQERYGEKGRNIAGELLMRSVLLACRILIVSVNHSRRSLEDTTRQLETTTTQVSSPWSGPLLQDQFNPELYGPGKDQYDHVLAGTLAVFWNLGFDETGDRGGSKPLPSIPFWLTQPVRRALRDLAKRSENNAERRVREAREKRTPNRLQTFLNRTPQEYAAEILRFAFPKYSNEEDLLLRGREVLLNLLQRVTDSDDIKVDVAPQRGGIRPDAIVTIKNEGKERQILVEAKTSAEPRYLRHAIIQLQQFLEKLSISYGVILAPSISERGRKICEENNVGYVDLAGNALVKFDGIYIKTAAQQRAAKRRRGRIKTLFAPVSTRLIRALLVEPKRAWKLKELAETVHMSIGQAYKVKQELFNNEFIEFDQKKRLVLKDPSGLLDAWREAYRYENNAPRSLFSLDKIPALEERVKQYCDTKKIGYALTLFTGADRCAPFIRHSMTALYFAGDIEAFQQELDLKPVDTGANIFLLTPYDEGVFYGLQEVEGYHVVSAVQLYLDLYSYGGRGREQAEFIREKLLAF
ncbi:MAG: SIR2 family protein [Desulfurellaceae bacterium]|nr:SIR2 family protein [Desulfurellaceae bacterium]